MARVKGFYLIGDFSSGRKASWGVVNEKPFEINNVHGYVMGKVLIGFKRNFVVSKWQFFEGDSIKDIDKDNGLRKRINDVWKRWCKEKKRKYIYAVEED